MSTMSDADLLLRVRARDREAMAALYDRHAARMYAVALRVTGSRDVAASVLEAAFNALANGAAPVGAGESWILRLVRDLAVARQSQTAAPSVEGMTPTPRSLVEEAFYRGADVAKLARTYGLTETDVRKMLQDGIRELRG
jgi:DNA-directed RNA polymerase specialized sigma24 family protein